MDKKETNRIALWLESIGYNLDDTSGDILHFASLPYTGIKKYRDEDKRAITILSDWRIDFHAGINSAGVGDGLKPDNAITYSLGCALQASIRPYKCQHDYIDDILKFYAYNRTLEGLKNKFYRYLISRAVR